MDLDSNNVKIIKIGNQDYVQTGKLFDSLWKENKINIKKEALLYIYYTLYFQPKHEMFCCPGSLWPEVSFS